MFRRLLLKLASATPQSFKRFVYRHPRLLGPLAAMLTRVVPATGGMIITISRGPNKGMKLEVDRNTPNYYWLNTSYENEVDVALEKLIQPGMRVADIGANIGFDTMLLAQRVGPTGHVLAFEPDPANLPRAQRNCQINNLTNITFIQKAVAENTGTQQFAAMGEPDSHLLPDSTTAPEGSLTIETTTLDDIVFAIPPQPLDFIKIDVEDFEVGVLKGATRLLTELRPKLIIEIHSPKSLLGCIHELQQKNYHLTPLSAPPCYQQVIEGSTNTEGFARAHILCLPTR